MADTITITGIAGIGHHGVFAHERENGQPFIVDVEISLDTRAAAASDDLSRTVDYGEVAEAVHGLIVGDPVDLVETLAERIAAACLAWPAVEQVIVTVHKPQAPIAVPFTDVAIRIVRARDAHA